MPSEIDRHHFASSYLAAPVDRLGSIKFGIGAPIPNSRRLIIYGPCHQQLYRF